jgi:hypothetical protein
MRQDQTEDFAHSGKMLTAMHRMVIADEQASGEKKELRYERLFHAGKM